MSSDARVPQSVDSTVEAGRRAHLLPHLHTLISRRIESASAASHNEPGRSPELSAVEWMTRTPSGKDGMHSWPALVAPGHRGAAADPRKSRSMIFSGDQNFHGALSELHGINMRFLIRTTSTTAPRL